MFLKKVKIKTFQESEKPYSIPWNGTNVWATGKGMK